MIGKVMRGRRVGGLLRYLYGAGRVNEHTDPHLAAAWDDPAALEPAVDGAGRRDLRRLTDLLEQPLHARPRTPARPVWHCALRIAPGDRRLTDAEWDDVVRAVLHRTGLAGRGDDGACRWVAVRHADDHVHLVVMLARADGGAVSTSNDFYRVGQACREVEQRYGLTVTSPRDRTADRRPSRGEQEKAARVGRAEAPRTALRREVRRAAAAADGPEEFFAALQAAGVLVRRRYSERSPDEVTGYAVALGDDRSRGGDVVWFGGGKLAADLSWAKLQRRWSVQEALPGMRPDDALTGPRRQPRLHPAARRAAWDQAVAAATDGAARVRHLAATDAATAGDAAAATGDLLTALARALEGQRRGPVTRAADTYARAARDLWGRPPARTPTGTRLRSAARLVSRAGRSPQHPAADLLRLVGAVAQLVEAVRTLRLAQHRAAQASAARAAALQLRAVEARESTAVPGARSAALAPTRSARPGQSGAPRRTP